MEYEEYIFVKVEDFSHPEVIRIEWFCLEHIVQKVHDAYETIQKLEVWRHIEEEYTRDIYV